MDIPDVVIVYLGLLIFALFMGDIASAIFMGIFVFLCLKKG